MFDGRYKKIDAFKNLINKLYEDGKIDLNSFNYIKQKIDSLDVQLLIKYINDKQIACEVLYQFLNFTAHLLCTSYFKIHDGLNR